MGRATLDGENLSKEVILKMSFELLSHNNEEEKHHKQRVYQNKVLEERKLGKFKEQKKVQWSWSIASKEEIS